jgi:4-azaleucine resistance transporter AzlC
MKTETRHSVLLAAFKHSLPVLFGYTAIGAVFGLMMADAGYPWWLSFMMSLVMFAGAGQYMAVGFFTAGTGVLEAALMQIVLNARHMAYSLSMINRFKNAGLYRFYLIFGLTDETFALLSSMPETSGMNETERTKFMFYVTALDQIYWIAGTLAGVVAGALLPFSTEGVGFSLTALLVVLMIEKIIAVRKPGIFIVSAIPAALGALFLPARASLLAAIAVSLAVCSFPGITGRKEAQ